MTTNVEVFNQAMSGELGDDQKRIASTAMSWLATLIRKNSDEGSAIWDAPSLMPNMTPASAILFRMSDTVSRLMSLSKNSDANPESFDDTIQDLAEYCLLYLASPERSGETTADTPKPAPAPSDKANSKEDLQPA